MCYGTSPNKIYQKNNEKNQKNRDSINNVLSNKSEISLLREQEKQEENTQDQGYH